MKKVSLVLTTYNCADNLKSTLKSIDHQDYENIEVIIKDGKSTDNTIQIIEEYQQEGKYPIVWKTEKDAGLYDAMNKGIAMTSGDVIAVFNEQFTDNNAVSKLLYALEQENDGDDFIGVHCDLNYMNGDKIIRKWRMGEGTIRKGWLPGHPTLFLKREIYEKYGDYNTQYKISADYEFMTRFLKENKNRLAYVPEVLVAMYYGGTSTSGLKSYIKSLKEGHHALKENGYRFAWIIDIRRTLRVLWQFVR